MAEDLVKVVIDCTNGVNQVKPMTAQDIAEHDQIQAQSVALEAERKAAEEALAALKESAKAKLIAGEPLTEEEAAVVTV